MKPGSLRYYLPDWSILAVGVISLVIIYFMIWQVDASGYHSVIDGDGKDYYSYLVSVFITKDLGHQDTTQWYITQTPTGTMGCGTTFSGRKEDRGFY